jgi:hypothetical protein
MNKLIKQHWNEFNDIKGSKKSKTQFFPFHNIFHTLLNALATLKFTLTSTNNNSNLTIIWKNN